MWKRHSARRRAYCRTLAPAEENRPMAALFGSTQLSRAETGPVARTLAHSAKNRNWTDGGGAEPRHTGLKITTNRRRVTQIEPGGGARQPASGRAKTRTVARLGRRRESYGGALQTLALQQRIKSGRASTHEWEANPRTQLRVNGSAGREKN
jgi:hypothetical protein